MKRRLFIKETTTVCTGLGLSTVSCSQGQINNNKPIEDVPL